MYPDVVLTSQDRGRKVHTVIEVETTESVNHLEALAEWVNFGRLKPLFHLYVPVAMVEVAKRLCSDHNIAVAEIHTYHLVGDELRFVPVYRAPAERGSRGHAATKKKPAKRAKTSSTGARRAAKPARKGSRALTAARSPKRK